MSGVKFITPGKSPRAATSRRALPFGFGGQACADPSSKGRSFKPANAHDRAIRMLKLVGPIERLVERGEPTRRPMLPIFVTSDLKKPLEFKHCYGIAADFERLKCHLVDRGFVFVMRILPETKNKTIEQIEAELNRSEVALQ